MTDTAQWVDEALDEELDRAVAPLLGRAPGGPGRGRRRWAASAVARGLVVVVAVVVVLLAHSIEVALTAPGTDAVAARLAIWARDHRAGALVNLGERLSYKPPKVGGAPRNGIAAAQSGIREGSGPPAGPVLPARAGPRAPRLGPPLPGTEPEWVAPAPPAPPQPTGPVPIQAPEAIAPIAGAALPDEGTWQTLETANGVPVLRATYLRADPVYTSYLSAVAWMDTHLLAFDLHPGTSDPGGGPYPFGASLPVGERGDVVAAFNSAFRMVDSRGGFFLAGRQVGNLREGAASIAFYNDGSVNVGEWGRDLVMTPDVMGVRQNLDLIVDGGQVNARIDDNAGNRWGATLGNDLYVWRSGVGVTRSGALVYAAGPRLSAATLAQLLVRAGALRAMELDINPSWTIFVHYAAGPGGSAPDKLLGTMQRPATIYDTVSSRDFIVAHIR